MKNQYEFKRLLYLEHLLHFILPSRGPFCRGCKALISIIAQYKSLNSIENPPVILPCRWVLLIESSRFEKGYITALIPIRRGLSNGKVTLLKCSKYSIHCQDFYCPFLQTGAVQTSIFFIYTLTIVRLMVLCLILAKCFSLLCLLSVHMFYYHYHVFCSINSSDTTTLERRRSNPYLWKLSKSCFLFTHPQWLLIFFLLVQSIVIL